MKRSGKTGQRLTAVFMMGFALLNYPLLSLFAGTGEIAGVPLLYAYVFATWVLLIGLMAAVLESARD